MDKLLQKLRQNMAELSLQGDDFTRQIWQMYATFEEFIDHQQSPGDDSSPPRHPTQDAPPPPPPAPSGGLGTPSISPSRDVTALFSSRVSPTMKTLAHSSVSLPTPSTRLRQKSPPVASDDLALASPRRSRRRRPRRLRRSVDNPLLDTISAIGGDSDEDSPLHHFYHSHGHNLHLQPHSPASCPRLHLETDIIGYAGSNSVDSGYKSSCPTPDLPDLIYPEHRLEKRGSLASLASSGSSGGSNAGSKPRIPMGTRVMSRGGGVPRSPGAGGGVTPTRRPGSDGNYYESEQLAALRQALLGSPTEGELRSLTGCRYSPRVSPATLPLNLGTSQRDIHVSRRAASPASPERRPRSASTGSRCSPGTRGPRKMLQSGSPHLASTGSLPRATSPGRRPSLSPAGRDDHRPPPAWSRHSSPGMGAPAGRGRRPPSPIVGVDQDHENELALLEREIDVLLYGGRGAQYYDIESGREFPCPFGGSQDNGSHSCRPALASVRRLRDHLQGTKISLLANESSLTSASETTITTTTTTTTSSPASLDSSSGSLSTTSSSDSFNFCSSEVAKCVLAMLEDFPKAGALISNSLKPSEAPFSSGLKSGALSSNGLKATEILGEGVLKELKTSVKKPRYRTTPYPREALNDMTDEGSSDCSSCSDYHLYEEILYDRSNKPPTHMPRPPSPPPLPKRPPLIQKASLELRGENTSTKINMKASTVKECSVGPPFSCCRCSCEFIPRKQIKRLNKASPVSKIEDSATCPRDKLTNVSNVSSEGDSTPPPPPIRTTSQMSTSCLIACSKPPVPPPAPPPPKSISATLKIPPLEPLAHNMAPPKPPRPKPVPPLRKSSKISEKASQNENSNRRDPSKDIFPSKAISSSDSVSVVSHTSKPKQRNNLYSIFKDRHHRRFLSASLELEYHHQPESLNNKESKNEDQVAPIVSVSESEKNNTQSIDDNIKPLFIYPSTISQISSSGGILKETSLKTTEDNLLISPPRDVVVDARITMPDKVSTRRIRPNRIGACHQPCSLDLNQNLQTDDEYGFQALPNVV